MKQNEANPDKKVMRGKLRVLSLFYDTLIYAVVFFTLFSVYRVKFFHTWMDSEVMLLHAASAFLCIFGGRFAFRIYRLVLRYGHPGVFARLLGADLIGGTLYVVGSRLFEGHFRIPTLMALVLVMGNLFVCMLARLVYHYMFLAAQTETPVGNLCHLLLRRFALVEARSERVAQIMSLDEWLGRTEAQEANPINDIQRVARQFQINGEITDIVRINKGYINQTYRVRTLSKNNHVHSYTLQRINTNVFPDADALMANFELVTKHLHDKLLLPGHTERGSVQMLKYTRDGKPYLRDHTGCWRMMTHFTEVYGMDIPDSPQTFYYAGQSFGMFVRRMSDVPPEKLKIVIPNFHNTYSRYTDLEKIVQEDPVHRLQDVWDEVNFVRNRKDHFRIISDALESGRIPTRICHNDCNLNNILFSKKTRLPVAIIDLDTVMPGSPLYDFGDSMRIGTNTARDDEKDLSKVNCDLTLYERYARGYLEACGDMLTREELELLPFASLIITAEDGIRFLADHIGGDTYYNIFYPGQNLDRARTQLKLLEDMETKLDRIRGILKDIYRDLGLDADPYWIQC